MLTLLLKGVQKNVKIFWLKIFLFATGVVDIDGAPSARISPRIFAKKFKMVRMGYCGAGGNLIYEENLVFFCPFKYDLKMQSYKSF